MATKEVDAAHKIYLKLRLSYCESKSYEFMRKFTEHLRQKGKSHYLPTYDYLTGKIYHGIQEQVLSESEMKQLKTLYKQLCFKYHPDKNPDVDPEIIKKINDCYKCQDLDRLMSIENSSSSEYEEETIESLEKQINSFTKKNYFIWAEGNAITKANVESEYGTEQQYEDALKDAEKSQEICKPYVVIKY